MAKVYVYSTLTSSNIFRFWKESVNGLPQEDGSILIKGGAGVADKNLVTPKGVMTELDEEEYKRLETHDQFQRMVEGGFIAVEKAEKKVEEVIEKKNLKKDKSAPKTPSDFAKGKEPKTK